MKTNKKVISLIITFALILNFSFVCLTYVSAHESILDVDYDGCIWPNYTSQTETKAWYVLYSRREINENSKCYHISHETQTIKYYFADESSSGYRWDDDISEELAEEIKTCYANSMEKWNNVYFYSYDSNDNIVKNKVINIVEGNSTDNNLVIYPYYENSTTFANTRYDEENVENIEIFEDEKIEHNHISEWYMNVNLYLFYLHGNVTEDMVNNARNKTGAHEIGHILGLRDIDAVPTCGAGADYEHHEELLMGYGNVAYRTSDITYKDIAGVAITRGFHTDSDHKWLYNGLDANGKHKLICSICNGVNAVDSLSGYTYDTYNACGENHTLSSGNMMAVASYGTSDYYKCKYCRYVAPFDNIVAQDYSIAQYNSALHKYTNNVNGLEYTFYKEHSFNYGNISASSHTATCECGYTITVKHIFTYESISNLYHGGVCACGYSTTGMHTTRMIDNRYSACTICGEVFDSWSDNIIFKDEEDIPQE
ncbi:MAG: hypothetical protein IJW53_02370 [Clostridia bacterium]|nr:hypothetical protein [Clostridia bacterium]